MTHPASPAAIALVEDDSRQVKGLATLLERTGFRTFLFTSSEQFENWLRANEPALVFLDADMPGESGLEAYVRLREAGRLGSSVPVLFLTGFLGADQTVAAYEAGAWDVVAKPVDPRILVAKCRSVLARTGRLPATMHAER
ncbi:MAG: response regulator [Candidatus Sericytochromatia bacterium]|nr:response regulator [Candidatus Sericytochromatia bacterium]